MEQDFERLERNLVFKGSIIDFYKDTIRVPNGNIVKWDFIKHKGAAAMVAVNEEGKILMVKQYRNALDRYTLEIPAGGLEPDAGDTMLDALRELEEETGYHSEHAELLISIRTTVAFCDEKIDIYYTNQLKKTVQNLDRDEFIQVILMDPSEVETLIYRGEIQDAKTISAFFAYQNKYGKKEKQ